MQQATSLTLIKRVRWDGGLRLALDEIWLTDHSSNSDPWVVLRCVLHNAAWRHVSCNDLSASSKGGHLSAGCAGVHG